MLLVGFLLLGYLVGGITPLNILPLFLVGIGVIFTLLGLSTLKEPGVYPKAYVGYGVLAIMIGVVWYFPVNLDNSYRSVRLGWSTDCVRRSLSLVLWYAPAYSPEKTKR